MKMSRSIWFFSFATVAMAGFAWVVADAQTLGKRKLPGSITNSNISNLPISYTKVPFTLSMCKMPEKISGDDKNVVYFAPVIDTGPEFPAKPTFKFRVYGMRSAEWKESPGNPMLFENSGAKLEFTWWEGPRLLRMRLTNTQKQIDERRWEGTAGPMFDTLAIDVNMHDNVGKHWYYTRLVEFVESSGTIRIPLPGTQ